MKDVYLCVARPRIMKLVFCIAGVFLTRSHTTEEIEYTTVKMETTKEIPEVVKTTMKINHSVEYVTDPTRTMICTTNQLSTIKEDDRAKLPQIQNLGLLEVKPLQSQNTGILKVTSLQTQNTGFLSVVQPHKIKYLDVPLKTSLKMLQTTNSIESSEQTPLINIDVRKFMRLYNYLRKKLQHTIKEQESLKTSALIDGGRTSCTSNQSAEPLSAVRDSVATKQMERSPRVTNVTTVRIPSRRVATSHVGRTLPARRAPDDDLPSAQSLANQKIVAKCYVCGLTSKHIPEDSNCSDAFSRREFLSLEPYDPRVRMQAIRFRRYCKYYHGYPWPFEHPEVPHSIFGEFTEGCSVRWTDAAGAYTQRACRIRRNPMRGNHLASKRMAQLEYLLRHSSEGCIESPMATLLPLTRTISLFARFHACVCKGNWCNAGCQTTPQMVAILLCSWFWKLL